MRNVTTLHHLLDDVTSLARLEAGREQRQIEPIDITPIFQQLCEGIRPLAQHHRLFLRCEGPAGFAADGDAVKIRRIAQNLILNAVKYTRDGGITVSWGDCGADDHKAMGITRRRYGPRNSVGVRQAAGQALGKIGGKPAPEAPPRSGPVGDDAGEGIGLSIVKRLCELLDATIELQSTKGVGTTFRILFPRKYLA